MRDLTGVIIGAGFFAEFQAEAWRRIRGVTIAAVADSDRAKAEAFAARFGIPRSFADPAEMIGRERPQFADIVTRPDSHLALTELAARAGVHVICQKPMAPTLEESAAMVRACEVARVRLLIHENWRWQPWYREIRRLIDAGICGNLFYIGFRLRTGDGRGPEPYKVQPYFRDMERLLIYETIVHFLDTFRYLAGEMRSVYCRTARVNPAIRGEDFAIVEVGFASGARGLIDANRISGPVPPEDTFGTLAVEGDRGMIRMSPDARIWITEYGRPELEHAYAIPKEGYRGDSVKAHQEHLASCLRTGERAESEGADYLKTVEAVFACYRSAETGAAQELR